MEDEQPVVEVVSNGDQNASESVVTQADHDQLRMLAIFHYVFAGLNGFGALLGALYICMGSFITAGAFNGLGGGGGAAPPAPAGWIIIGTGSAIMLWALLTVALEVAAAVSLQNGKRKTLCIICSILHFLNIPLGTALGIFTLVALNKPGIKTFFEQQKTRS